MKVVDEFCVKHRGSMKDAAAKAAKLPFNARSIGEDKGPPPLRGVWLGKLGTGSFLYLAAKRTSEPISECKVVSPVDLADLVARQRATSDLGEPKSSEVSIQLTAKGGRTIGEKAYAVELVCGFEENKPSGAFTLTVNR